MTRDLRLGKVQEEEKGAAGETNERCEKLVSQFLRVMRREERADYIYTMQIKVSSRA